MKLLRLSFHDPERGWGFNDLRFFSDVTLLVGASGVGKTRVLNSIRKLREITQDETLSVGGVSWSVDFLDDVGKQYTWEGEFEPYFKEMDAIREWIKTSKGNPDDLVTGLQERMKPLFVRESLKTDKETIFLRNSESFQINGKRIDAKLSQSKSGFALFDDETSLQGAKKSIESILVSDDLQDNLGMNLGIRVSSILPVTLNSIEKIKRVELPTIMKLFVASQSAKSTFNQIVVAFQDIFPTIEKVWVEEIKSEEMYLDHVFHFKEKGVSQTFNLASLSSGMKRTLFHLARLALWPDGTVILIDEFENSLGTNCIDVVADALLKVGNRLQFVISSHHPYIINSIPVDHWKIVARDKGQVQFFSAEQLKIGRSKHKAFTELNNTDVFRYGQIPT